MDEDLVTSARRALVKGNEVYQMMKVLGEEGTSLEDFVAYLKGEFLDHVYLQQNAFDEVDGATARERQIYVFGVVMEILQSAFNFQDKDHARRFFQSLRQAFVDWNYRPWQSDAFAQAEGKIRQMYDEVRIREADL
jgi:V/A-type H+-transporting ATPase subunit A